ncbi:hypothetical protein RB653_006023 [Dictyostelium firmibasis]|uniref:Dihydrolipoamide acetyltransferase component of pyruvate dehydrogenase complex n=1 Tax=Dictyostelium firmibasis TaxID=79012 RepID=A0AAN7U8Q6_9MYCE
MLSTRQILTKSKRLVNVCQKQQVVRGISTTSNCLIKNSTENDKTINSINQQIKPISTLNKIINNRFEKQISVRNYSSGNAPIKFNLADVGEGIAECEVLIWYVKEGDQIKEFDKLCEVQSDKATVEITSRYDGIVTKICHKIGDMAKVGEPLVEITPEGSVADAKLNAGPASQTTAPTTTTNINDQSSPSSSSLDHHEYDITKNGQKYKVLATPSVRNLAKLNSINLNTIQGTGKDGRVLKENLLDFLNGVSQSKTASIPIVQKTTTTTTTTTFSPTESLQPPVVVASPINNKERETRVPISGIKKVMVKSMNAATAVPHFGFSEEYIMDALTFLRNQMKPMAESRGIKLSYMPFLIKATSLALSRYPVLNSSVSPTETEIIYKNYHNIGVAMDTPQGLLVPNIKNVESKSIFEIAQELNRLQKAGIAGQLTPADMSGGTFSLSNIGTIGGTYCSPVLLLPEVCIGAIGKIQKLPRFDKSGNVIPQSIMIISWSGDHRVIDGATIANFSNVLKGYIENPSTMLFDTR